MPRSLPISVLSLLLLVLPHTLAHAASPVLDIRDFGAKGDGKTLATKAIQKAIDQCASQGGGTVYLPPGAWLSGTLFMKDHVTLWLSNGATLLGSKDLADYPQNISKVRSWTDRYVDRSLIAGEDLKDIAIRGRGTIDGNGAAFPGKKERTRPHVIRLVRCQDILLEDVHLRNSAMWMQQYMACDRVTVRGMTVFNHCNGNNDGIDIDACHDVHISDSTFDSDDDAIVLKSTLDRACENVTISGCLASTHCNAIKLGTETHGGFKNIVISNCTVCSPRFSKVINGSQPGLAGIALELVDGGRLDRVTVSNIAIEGVTTPILLRLGNRARLFKEGIPKPGVGAFRNVVLSNIVATGASELGCAIAGIPGHPIENVTLSNIKISFAGGGTKDQTTRSIPENEDAYPECGMFGPLPAYGFYCRHVRGLTLDNIQVQTEQPDLRHAIVCDDVANLRITGLDAQFSPGAAALIRLVQVQGALISGCAPQVPGAAFLQLDGLQTQRIALTGNDLDDVETIVAKGNGVPTDAVRLGGNVGKQP